MKGLEALANMEYPGRVIIIGRDVSGKRNIIVYAITGRSSSSQARKLEINDAKEQIIVKPTNEEELNKGNRELLVYPAIIGNSVSNGKQTKDVQAWIEQQANPIDVLRKALNKWEYEPDKPNYTPRISGCITPEKGAALSIIKRAEDGPSVRHYFEIPLIPGKGKLIATYTGENKNPLPSFIGEPLDVELKGNHNDIAEAVYSALDPLSGDVAKDFRVSVAVVSYGAKERDGLHKIINRCDGSK